MSNYHRATHRVKDNYPAIVNHASATRNMDLEEIPRGTSSTEKALVKSKVGQAQIKSNQQMPKKTVNVNVSKASPDVQGAIKRTSKKTGKDTYEYKPKKK